jgi:hypothetical protein
VEAMFGQCPARALSRRNNPKIKMFQFLDCCKQAVSMFALHQRILVQLFKDTCVLKILFDFLQFVWSQVTSPKIYEIFRRSQCHKGSIRKVLTNLTQKIRSERPCGALLYEKFRKSHRAQARVRKDHFVVDVTRQSAVRIERNGTVCLLRPSTRMPYTPRVAVSSRISVASRTIPEKSKKKRVLPQ